MKNGSKYNNQLSVIGPIISKYRQNKNLSQNELSTKLLLIGIDIPKNSIQKLECGNRSIKDFEIAGVCKVLNITPNDLLNDFIKNLDKN